METNTYKSYKEFRSALNKIASDYFISNKYPVHYKYSFILDDKENWKNNIICSGVADYIDKRRIECIDGKIAFPIHKYIHHGLSSQAMLFNLLGDVVIKNDISFLKEIFSFVDVVITEESELKFEHYNRKTFNENQQQPTSFDFAILNESGKNIFLEAKLVETEFGKCSAIESGECDGLNPINDPNLCYLTHKGRNYLELMKKYGFEKAYEQSTICPFTIYYQFFRELLFAIENNGYYVILIDKRNPAFEKIGYNEKRGLIPILLNQIPEEYHKIIKVIYIQDIIPILEKHGYIWVKEFREKYGME